MDIYFIRFFVTKRNFVDCGDKSERVGNAVLIVILNIDFEVILVLFIYVSHCLCFGRCCSKTMLSYFILLD